MKKCLCLLLALMLILGAMPALAEIADRTAATPTPQPNSSRNVIVVSRSTATPAPTKEPETETAEKTSAPQKNKVIVVNNRTQQSTPTATPTPTPAPTATPASAGKTVVVNVHSAKASQPAAVVTAVPTATPIPAAEAVNYFQDPITFGEGNVVFHSNDDNAYCKRSNYQVINGSAVDFAKAYAEMCKNNPCMTYLEFFVSPSGWDYYCFEAAPGTNYTPFSTSSGDWSTGALCLSISCSADSQFITLRWSFELQMGDLGYRLSAPAAAGPVQASAAVFPLDALKQTWLSKDQYYYNQLSDAHKAAWEDNIVNILHYPDQTPSSTRDVRHQALAPMIKADNPRIFWIDWIDSNGRLRYETGSVATYAALQFPDGETLASLQETFLAAIPKAVAAIEKTLPANPTAKDKARAIHDWLCKNNRYNEKQTVAHKGESDPVAFAYLAAHSAYSAIIPGDAYEPVCEGYACAFKILCEEFGLEAICVSGSTKNISNHMWNYVKLDDGQWYLVDVDSDDLAANYVHNYFLIGQSKSAAGGYTTNPYMSSGVNPDNGYTEGAAFTVPTLAK